jgi:DNA-binding HxlR family transcriptional regulator
VDPAALDEALSRVGDRWSLAVVAALIEGPRRFTDLRDALPGIAPNILSARLRDLEGHGLLIARPYSTRPPRLAYELTSAGRGLEGPLRALAAWGAGRGAGDPPRHGCGTPLEARMWCPACGVEAGEDDDRPEDAEVSRV